MDGGSGEVTKNQWTAYIASERKDREERKEGSGDKWVAQWMHTIMDGLTTLKQSDTAEKGDTTEKGYTWQRLHNI